MEGTLKGWVAAGAAAALLVTLTSVTWSQGKGGGKKPPKGGDSTPPGTVSDLGVSGVTSESVTLDWTAPPDDGTDCGSGPVDQYDLRFSTSSIVDETAWGNAHQANGEPSPPGTPCVTLESFTQAGLLPDTLYYFRLRAVDEAGNESEMSNEVSATTVPGSWSMEGVDIGGTNQVLAYNPVDLDPSIAYSADGVKFADRAGTGWAIEDVGSGGAGLDFGYSPSGDPGISYLSPGNRKRKVLFATKVGASWNIETVDTGVVPAASTTIAHDSSGNPAIAYSDATDLFLARSDGTSWNIEVAEAGSWARYLSLAFDQDGNPSIAYSIQVTSSNRFDTLKYARKIGASWEIEVIDEDQEGFIRIKMAYDPTTGDPSIAYTGGPSGGRILKFATRDGGTGLWSIPETVDGPCSAITGVSHAYDGVGTASISYISGCANELKLAQKILGVWEFEVVKGGGAKTSLAFDPVDSPAVNPSIAFKNPPTDELVFAVKN